MLKAINMKRTVSTLLVLVALFASVLAIIPRISADPSDSMAGDMTTNIPDSDIGGAVSGNESTNTPGTSGQNSESSTNKGDEGSSGAEITTPSVTSSPQTTPAVTTSAQTTKTTTPEQTTNTPVDTSDGRGWIIAVIIVAIIAAVIIAVIALMPSKKDREK